MTLNQVQALRDKYYNALLAIDPTDLTHAIGDASYDNDQHRANLQAQFDYYDKLYTVKANAGQSPRLDKKAV